ncbi:hypothetical protein G5714_004120 [Onychostoma macrolepis]|uniref:DUF4806 domain-containing protein n=1 Tax=Onychostoma macrolepis TaxID=369639 RepID=A0A7J6DBW5_9TELE|nr:hypothetical protein G5714_004120 [Onychostoma macrolepis]
MRHTLQKAWTLFTWLRDKKLNSSVQLLLNLRTTRLFSFYSTTDSTSRVYYSRRNLQRNWVSDAEQEGELPEKRVRKPVHRFGDSDESEEEPENGDFASLRSSRPFNLPGVSAEASSSSQLHWQTPPSRRVPGSRVTTPQPGENCLAPDHGAGQQHPSPPQLPAPAFNIRRVTQGTAGPPQLPPPPAPALNMRRTEEPCSSLTYRPTWRGGRMTDTIPCSAAEVHILSLLETIKQQQDQLVARVNYLSSRLNHFLKYIHFPLEHLEAVEAFEMFLKEPSNGPARQRVISSLATIGGQDVKRVTWNILGRLFTDEVSPQINWKGVNNKSPSVGWQRRPCFSVL